MPGLVHAFKEIQKTKSDTITPKLAFKLYDTYGLDEDIITTLATAMKLKFDPTSFHNELSDVKKRSKETSAFHTKNAQDIEIIKNTLPPTVDCHKYAYKKLNDRYIFDHLNVQCVAILKNGKLVQKINPNTNCDVILNQTNFYAEAGGQQGDIGVIKFKNGDFVVSDVKLLQNYVVHSGILKSELALSVGDVGVAQINENARLNTMRNHTGVHLLNAALKTLDRATCQKSSKVTDEFLSFDVGVFGNKLSVDDSVVVENLINKIIKETIDVKTSEVDSEFLYGADDVTLIPGEVYPDTNVRLIEIYGKNGFVSRFFGKTIKLFCVKVKKCFREPCCGTHVHNTGDIEEFFITGFKSLGRSTTSIVAVTGDRAKIAKQNGAKISEQVTQLQKSVDDNKDKVTRCFLVAACISFVTFFTAGNIRGSRSHIKTKTQR